MENDIDIILKEPTKKLTSLIEVPEIEKGRTNYISNLSKNSELIKSLFEPKSSVEPASILGASPSEVKQIQQIFIGRDVSYITPWKNIQNISARLIEHYDDVVILECLIDKEGDLYEEREFSLFPLFDEYELKVGGLFYLRYFSRQNEIRMEVLNDPNLTSTNDFPKMDFVQLFKDSKLSKKK